MADMIYSVDLDARKYKLGLESLVAQAKKSGTDMQSVFAKMDARVGVGRELGTRDTDQSLTVFGRSQAAGVTAAGQVAKESEGVLGRSMANLVRVGVIGFALKKAWHLAVGNVEEYAKINEDARVDLSKMTGAVTEFQQAIGRDTAASAGIFQKSLGNEISKSLSGINKVREAVVDLLADTAAVVASPFTGDDVGYGNSAAARRAQKESEALQAQFKEAQRINELRRVGQLNQLRARQDAGEEVGVDIARMEAAQRLADARKEINKVEGVGADERRELLKLAEQEAAATVHAAEVNLAKRREQQAQEQRAERQRAEQEAVRQHMDAAHRNDEARFAAQRANADTLLARGREAEGNAAGRRLELDRELYAIRQSEVDADVKRMQSEAVLAKYAAEEDQVKRQTAESVRDAAQAALLGAKQSTPFYQKAAELAGRRLEQEKQLDELRRRGASEDQLRTVGLLQDQELAALALEAARSGVKLPRSGRVAAGFSGFAGQVVGGGGGQDYSKTISDNVGKLNKQVTTITDQLRRLNDTLQGVGTLQ